MATGTSLEGKRSWRGAPRGTLVRRSRHLWRWLLTGLALVLIVLAVLWAWPHPLPRTMLLVLSGAREERTLPLVPFVEGDCSALLDWAQGAKVPACQRQLIEITTPHDFLRRLALDPNPQNRLPFTLEGHSGELRLGASDTLVIYIKGHGLAIDISQTDAPDVRPLLIKSLSETDLATPWFRDEAHTIDVGVLLAGLAKLPELRKLVILDAVHLSYDPRLGTLVNAFPQAVREAVERLPQRSNLWVVLGQGDGELGVGLPGADRSAFVDCLVKQLERQPGGGGSVNVDDLIAKTQSSLDTLVRGGFGSFKQTLQKSFPSRSGPSAALLLPTSPPPPPEGQESGGGSAAGGISAKLARKVRLPSAVSGAVSTARKGQRVAAKISKATAAKPDKQEPADTAANKGAPASSDGKSATAATPAAPGDKSPAPAAGAPVSASAEPAAAKSDLDLAWEAHDRLRSRPRDGWSPVHVAPDEWRRVEGLLAGFDEEELTRGLAPRDQATVELLRSDLGLLDALFHGREAQSTPGTDECQKIAEALARFPGSAPFRSFQARQGSGLEQANDALKAFAEAAYRAVDYVRLHGQTAGMLDGGPLLNDGALETLLDNLAALRGLLNPATLAEGRLTDSRLRDLSRTVRDVESGCRRLDDDIASYARGIAAAPPSPGSWLRASVLLHSPLLGAELRAALRQSSDEQSAGSAEPAPSSSASINERLTTNLRLARKLLGLALPAASGAARTASVERFSAARIHRLVAAIEAANVKTAPLLWAPLGRQFRDFGEALPVELNSDFEQRAGGQAGLPATDMLELYLTSLLIDGRDAPRWHDRNAPFVVLAQPLKAELLPDRIELTVSSQSLKLPSLGSEGAKLGLTIRVQSERPPPYPVVLEMSWDTDLNVVRQDSGPAIRSGRNELRLDRELTEMEFRVSPRRESRDDSRASVRAQARFASASPATAEATCLLPRPDQVELAIAADNDLNGSRRRIWFPHAQQGGRLNFFANRDKTFQLYITNLSGDEKRLHARLYRVPMFAAGPAGRLFDPRLTNQLLGAAADFDTRLSQPGADPVQILREYLIAQTDEKAPLQLGAGQAAVKVPLTGAAPAAAAPPAGGAKPVDKGEDITSGLLLVLSSAEGKAKPFLKWIELQMLQPDDLLQVMEPGLRDGKLSFRVGLKDRQLVEEMGLAKQPLALVWDSQSLPAEVREPTKEAAITAVIPQAEFSAKVSSTIRWPLYFQIHVDRDPRGLVASLDRSGDGFALANWKENRPPTVHITRVLAAAQRSNGQPEKFQVLIRPPAPWLAYPAPPVGGEAIPVRDPGEPLLVRVDPQMPTVRLEADIAADVAVKYFADGARIRATIEQQVKEFAADRQATVRLTAIDDAGLHVHSDVSDFVRQEFEPIDVKQDKRLDLVADVSGGRVGSLQSDYGPDVVRLILDRTPPVIGQLIGEKLPPRPTTTPNVAPQSRLVMNCHADDGEGSGVAKVEFVVGFDLNSNDQLDKEERRPPIAAVKAAEGTYAAEYLLPNDLPSERLLIEATAIDNVQHTSATARYGLTLPRKVEGGQRTTFGGKKIEAEAPPGKKKP